MTRTERLRAYRSLVEGVRELQAARPELVVGAGPINDLCGFLFATLPLSEAALEDETDEETLREVTCPQCGKWFVLTWGEYGRVSLAMRGCPSGGIYDVRIRCPHCDYEEEL